MDTNTLVDATSWNQRLASLLGQERRVQVEFLLALAEFAERRLYLDLGFSSLWDYCMRGLHLREGATFLRTHGVALLRRFPAVVEPLRDGRLCLSTLVELEPVLTEANFRELLDCAAYRTKAEVKQVVASLAPKPAPADSLRRAPTRAASSVAASAAPPPPEAAMPLLDASAPVAAPVSRPARREEPPIAPVGCDAPRIEEPPAGVTARPPHAVPSRSRGIEMAPLSGEEWLLRMRLSDRVRGKLATARALASHAIPDGSWEAVLEAALDCYIERLEKRRAAKSAASAPADHAHDAAPSPAPPNDGSERRAANRRGPIPAAVRRAVWVRDRGSCAFEGPDGTRCGSRLRLELDHVVPVARGGPSTVANLRLLCRRHNVRHAENLFGEPFMRQFERR